MNFISNSTANMGLVVEVRMNIQTFSPWASVTSEDKWLVKWSRFYAVDDEIAIN